MHKLQESKESPLSVFISYAHEDEFLRQQLEAHLSLLRRQKLIADWHDRQIPAGEEWAREIDQHLETASIILLLISPDFLASDYCYDIEMQRALERHKRGEARVIPIILRPVDWHDAPFGHLQCLPRDGKSIREWDNLDTAFREIAQELRRILENRTSSVHSAPRFPSIDQQHRLRLLKRVRAIWIEGVLMHSLHQAALVALNLQEQPDALANPWQLEVQETNLPPHPLPAGTSIVQVYDEEDGELLILGEPGAGKTTLLLTLADTLLKRAEESVQERIPVVFHLSSWALKCQELAEWLVEELGTKYQMPKKLAQAWIDSYQILPLLDGLDEVEEKVRQDCMQAINKFHMHHQKQGAAPLVVCCRSQEYRTLSTKVQLQQAVTIQPLTPDQIESYLQSTRGQLEGLRHALRDDPKLYELASRPLMVSIFTLAYQGVMQADLPMRGTREAKQYQVFAAYAKRMFTRRGISKRYSPEQMEHWLTFLAAQMSKHDQAVLYLWELELRPGWLTGPALQMFYRLNVALVAILLFILPFGLVSWFVRRLLHWPSGALGAGLILGLIAGSVAGLLVELVLDQFRLSGEELSPYKMWDWENIIPMSIIGLCGGLILGFLLGGPAGYLRFIFGLSAGPLPGSLGDLVGIMMRTVLSALAVTLSTGLIAGLLFGLIAGLLRGLSEFYLYFTLRFWLCCAGIFPWNLKVFLGEAAERLLMRKVGGGYSFIHRLLLDYFASLETPSSEKESPASASFRKPGNYSSGGSSGPVKTLGQAVPARIHSSRRRRQRKWKNLNRGV